MLLCLIIVQLNSFTYPSFSWKDLIIWYMFKRKKALVSSGRNLWWKRTASSQLAKMKNILQEVSVNCVKVKQTSIELVEKNIWLKPVQFWDILWVWRRKGTPHDLKRTSSACLSTSGSGSLVCTDDATADREEEWVYEAYKVVLSHRQLTDLKHVGQTLHCATSKAAQD